VAGGPRDGLHFRQVELELCSDETAFGRGVTARFEEVGLAVENSPKLATAMGWPAAHSTRPSIDRSSLLADVVRAAIGDDLARLLDHDWRLRVALPEAGRDLYQARVALRRLAAHLQTFSAVLDPVWVQQVRTDLEWAGSPLEELRDADVLAGHLKGAPAQLRQELTRQRSVAARQAALLLANERYLDLLDRLHAAAGTPPFFVSSETVRADTVRVDDPASGALPKLLGVRWQELRHDVRKVGDKPKDRQLDRIRKSARHLRFTAEVAVPFVGKSAGRTAAGAAKIQTILGEYLDAVAAEKWLKEQVGHAATSRYRSLSPDSWFEAGRLAANLRRRQHQLRSSWPGAWKALNTPRRRRS
jgi:CHAD domain-containing protein